MLKIEPTRFVNKHLSDLWKIPTPEAHSISEPFWPEVFAAALRRLKPGKSKGLDSIFPEFTLHAGSARKSWFCNFLSSYMRQLKISKIWRIGLVVADPYAREAIGGPKELSSYISAVRPIQNPRGTYLHSCWNNHRPTAPTGAGGLSTRAVGRRPGHPVDIGHRG